MEIYKRSVVVYFSLYIVLLIVPVIPIITNMVEVVRIQYYVAVANGIGTFLFLLALSCIENMTGRYGGLFDAVLAPFPSLVIAAYFLENLAVLVSVGVYLFALLIYWDIQERIIAKEQEKSSESA